MVKLEPITLRDLASYAAEQSHLAHECLDAALENAGIGQDLALALIHILRALKATEMSVSLLREIGYLN